MKIYLIILIFIILNLINICDKFTSIKKKNCCLVKKQENKKGFYYKYYKSKCDLNLIKNENMKIISNCKSKKNNLGSCRLYNFECIDFVNKNYCDRYKNLKMRWSNKPCNMPLKWKLKVPKQNLPININNSRK